MVELSDLGSIIKTTYEAEPDTGDFAAADRTKLNGIAAGATANDTDANLKNRANHTGVQPINTITGLEDALAAISGGTYRAEDNSGVKGTGVSGAQRILNAAAITAAIADADAANGKVDLGGGTWEVDGTITAGGADFVIDGSGGKIVQFATTANVLTMASAVNVTVYNLELEYNTNQTTGDSPVSTSTYHAAIRLTGTSRNCNFTSVKISKAWVGIGMSGTNTGHKFENTYSIMSASNSYAHVLNGATGCTYINSDVTGNGSDIACSGAVLAINTVGCEFGQLRVDRLSSAKPIVLSGSKNVNFENLRIEGVTPLATSTYAGVVHLENDSQASFENLTVTGLKLNKTTGLVDVAHVFVGGTSGVGGGTVRVREMWVTNTAKTGVVSFGMIGSQSSALPIDLHGEFEGIRFDTATSTPHQMDHICNVELHASSVAKNGIVRRFNQTVGEMVGGYITWGDVSATVYPEIHGRWQRWNTPLTANRTLTLSNRIAGTYGTGPLNAPLVPKGATIWISRTAAATGAFSGSVADNDGTVIGTLAVGQTGGFVFDGQNWSGFSRATF